MAITTSPDNIPSPTSGDPYNYVVDMAALADGTQDALTQKANMGVGTSTQRTAALGGFPDGALWYDTTTSSEWRRVAGAWVEQPPLQPAIQSHSISFSGSGLNSGVGTLYRNGRNVFLMGVSVQPGSLANGGKIASIPATFRPSLDRVDVPLVPNANTYGIAWLRFEPNGDVFLFTYGSASGTTYNRGSGAWLGPA